MSLHFLTWAFYCLETEISLLHQLKWWWRENLLFLKQADWSQSGSCDDAFYSFFVVVAWATCTGSLDTGRKLTHQGNGRSVSGCPVPTAASWRKCEGVINWLICGTLRRSDFPSSSLPWQASLFTDQLPRSPADPWQECRNSRQLVMMLYLLLSKNRCFYAAAVLFFFFLERFTVSQQRKVWPCQSKIWFTCPWFCPFNINEVRLFLLWEFHCCICRR